MATLNIELLKHCVRFCRRQMLHVDRWEQGVKRFLRDGFRMVKDREAEHEEAEYQNETNVRAQRGGRVSG